jgi:hypothetical protein
MKGKQIDTAWRLGFRGDYSLIEEMISPEYLCLDHRMGLEANFEVCCDAGMSLIKSRHVFSKLD